jgi:lysophospholipase L1-like esterase
MHYGLLRNRTYLTGESGGLLPLTVTSQAQAGAMTINVDSTTALIPGQLITYLGENFDYNVAEISSLTDNTITLTNNTTIVSKIATGTNVWNFYDEPFTANHFGQKALADLSYRKTATTVNSSSTHVVIGDEWLNNSTYTDRLEARYAGSNFINKTGNADGLCDLLADFDKDVAPNNPQYVWIASSTSDYQVGVSQEDYKARLQDLIAKVQGIGATAIVFDSVAGSAGIVPDGVVNTETLAHRYSSQVLALFNEANASNEVSEPVVVTPTEPVVVEPTPITPIVVTPTEPVVVEPTSVEPVVVEPTPTEPVTVTPTEPENIASCSATAEPITSFTRVEMHYGLLNDQGFQSDSDGQSEIEGFNSYTVSGATSAGATSISLDSTDGLVAGQLVTYLGTDNFYRVATIESLTSSQITIATADSLLNGTPNDSVVSGINAGETLWNFYFDPDHPNASGYNSIADFGYSYISGIAGVDEATHVLLGDSWFSNSNFEDRVRTRLPNATIINHSTGGNTLCDLLDTFDTDVTSKSPNYVWINSGVNDYFDDVSVADYTVRLQNLIAKVQSIGAVAVVFDSAPAPNGTTSSGNSFKDLSNGYAFQTLELFNQANGQ